MDDGTLREVSWFCLKDGKPVRHGCEMRFFPTAAGGGLSLIMGYVHGRERPGRFSFAPTGRLKTARVAVDEDAAYAFQYNEEGREIGQALVVGEEVIEGTIHELFLGLNSVKHSTLDTYAGGQLVKSIECDIDGTPLGEEALREGSDRIPEAFRRIDKSEFGGPRAEAYSRVPVEMDAENP